MRGFETIVLYSGKFEQVFVFCEEIILFDTILMEFFSFLILKYMFQGRYYSLYESYFILYYYVNSKPSELA